MNIKDGEELQIGRRIPQPGEEWVNSKNAHVYEIEMIAQDISKVPDDAQSANNVIGLVGPQVVYKRGEAGEEKYFRNLDEFMGTRWDGTHYVFRFVKVNGV